jgi:hypothetical protein
MFNFFRKKYESHRILKIGKAANKYARSQIIKGGTQLENNKLDPDYLHHLKKGVEEGSKVPGWKGFGVKDIIEDEAQRRVKKGEKPAFAYYNSIISVTSKYSLGNCNELAVQALDYILRHAPDISAEVYKIEGGDHAFLVLNRDPSSAAEDPNTWGPNAVICDPWTNENEVYPAKECFTRLKSYYWDENENCHKTERYDPEKHFLMPSEYFNTIILRPSKS